MREQNTIYKIALKLTPQVGSITARSLISYCGGIEQVFKASKKQLIKAPGVGEKTVDFLKSEEGFEKGLIEAEKELALIEKHDIKVLFYTDEGYPQRLKHYTDSPILIYYKGTANLNHHYSHSRSSFKIDRKQLLKIEYFLQIKLVRSTGRYSSNLTEVRTLLSRK